MDDRVAVVGAGGGSRLRLRVKPGARRSRLCGAHGGALKLEVTAPPERGRANDAVVELLAAELGLPRCRVRVAAGATSQDKVVEILDAGPAEVVAALERAGIPATSEPHPGGGVGRHASGDC